MKEREKEGSIMKPGGVSQFERDDQNVAAFGEELSLRFEGERSKESKKEKLEKREECFSPSLPFGVKHRTKCAVLSHSRRQRTTCESEKERERE